LPVILTAQSHLIRKPDIAHLLQKWFQASSFIELHAVAQIWLEYWGDAGWIHKAWWGEGLGYPFLPIGEGVWEWAMRPS